MYTCWPSVCLWKNVYSDPLPIFLIGLFLANELSKFLIYFGYEALITSKINDLQIFSPIPSVAFLFC